MVLSSCVYHRTWIRLNIYNLGQSICRSFYVLAKLLFTTSKITRLLLAESECRSWITNCQVAEQANTSDLKKLRNFKKISDMLGFLARTQQTTQNANFDICAKTFQKLNCKTFHRKHTLLTLVILFTIVCRRLSENKHFHF